ncbi:RraA family protein [Brevibacillus marinus]|uniref:RraA family protein n=1 Tax=Brevibacillus marinus TaxID=2496837 RepID=UPI001F49B3A7|nr:RraA family protein [Brevibacillus marinus]
MKVQTGLRINPNPPLLSDEIIARARKLSTPLLSDVMGCFGAMDYTIKSVSPGMKVFGTAITVSLRPGDNLFLHKALYSAQKGYVLVIDGKGHTKNAPFGEILARAAISVGIEGIVLDGVARDRAALIKLGLPVFTKGFVPTGGDKDGPGEINVNISCGGVSVAPGDLIAADDDGVVVVPRDRIEQVLELAEKKALQEEKRIQDIISGNLKPSWFETKWQQYK